MRVLLEVGGSVKWWIRIRTKEWLGCWRCHDCITRKLGRCSCTITITTNARDLFRYFQFCDCHSHCSHCIAMVKGIKRKAEDSVKKSASKALRRVAGPTTSQIRDSKQSIRSLAAAVEMLQETEDMKHERELVKRMRMMTIDNADGEYPPLSFLTERYIVNKHIPCC